MLKLGHIVCTVKMPEFLKNFFLTYWKRSDYQIRLKIYVFLFLFFFALGFTSHSVAFDSYGVVAIISEGLHILTYTTHPWPLSSESSIFNVSNLLLHGTTVYMIISEDLWHPCLSRAIGIGAVTTCLRSVMTGDRSPRVRWTLCL